MNSIQYYNEITIMKVIAIIFITLFHMKWSVPEQYQNFFIGGAVGNSLFFYASGHLLSLKKEQFYGQWLLRKFLRLWPSVWVFLLWSILFSNEESMQFNNYLYPTPFWFINCIFLFFFICFIFRNKLGYYYNINIVNKHIILLFFITLIIHITLSIYGKNDELILDIGGYGYFNWPFFFAFFLWGYFDRVNHKILKATRFVIFIFPTTIALFFLYKTLCNSYSELIHLQYIFVPLLLGLIVYTGHLFSLYISKLPLHEYGKRLLSLISNITLDIYIVGVFLIQLIMPHIIFPLNVLVTFVAICIIGWCNNKLAIQISSIVERYIVDIIKNH